MYTYIYPLEHILSYSYILIYMKTYIDCLIVFIQDYNLLLLKKIKILYTVCLIMYRFGFKFTQVSIQECIVY